MLTHQIKGVVAQSRPHESIRHCSSALKRSFRLLSEGRSRAKELAARPHSACSPAACELSLAARGGPRAGRQVGPRARARRSGHSSGPIRAGAEPEGSYWRRGQLCLHRSTAGSRRRLQANLGREHEHGAPHNPPDAQAPQSGRWHKSPSDFVACCESSSGRRRAHSAGCAPQAAGRTGAQHSRAESRRRLAVLGADHQSRPRATGRQLGPSRKPPNRDLDMKRRLAKENRRTPKLIFSCPKSEGRLRRRKMPPGHAIENLAMEAPSDTHSPSWRSSWPSRGQSPRS